MSIIKQLLGWVRTSKKEEPIPDINLTAQLEHIEKKEAANEIESGRKIHSFHYGMLEIKTDRDITEQYRIIVWQGKEWLFSFSIFSEQGEYEKLGKGFSEISDFLKGDQKISSLPDNDLLKGLFYGH
jgi:hypothetical protein